MLRSIIRVFGLYVVRIVQSEPLVQRLKSRLSCYLFFSLAFSILMLWHLFVVLVWLQKKCQTTIKDWDMVESSNIFSFARRKIDPRDLLLERLILLVRDRLHGFICFLHRHFEFMCSLLPRKSFMSQKSSLPQMLYIIF